MWAKIATWFMDYVVKRVASWFNALLRQNKKVKDQNSEAEKQADNYQKEVDDSTKTREERRRATDEFLNS